MIISFSVSSVRTRRVFLPVPEPPADAGGSDRTGDSTSD